MTNAWFPFSALGCGVAFLLVAIPLRAHAEDIKLANGTVVRGDISRVEPDGLVVATDAGVEKISFLMLPEETQKRYGFDLKKADEFRAQQAALRKQQLEQQTAAIQQRAARLEQLQQNEPSLAEQQQMVKIQASGVSMRATIVRGLSNGAIAELRVPTGRAARTMLDKDTRSEADAGTGFIRGLRAADGEVWEGKLYPAGYYTYNSPFDGEHTIKAYALTPEAALGK